MKYKLSRITGVFWSPTQSKYRFYSQAGIDLKWKTGFILKLELGENKTMKPQIKQCQFSICAAIDAS